MADRLAGIAKTSPPDTAGALPRTRLFRILDQCGKKRIVWISGPAGSGKTTLVASYLNHRRLPCLWYHVDERDADPATFFYYLGLAAKKAAPRHRRPLPHLTPEYLQGVLTFARRYFEELCRRLKTPCALIFDNYQDAASPLLNDILRVAVESMPAGFRVIVLSRTETPVALARLRAHQAIALVGWPALSFTSEEIRAFLKARLGRPVSVDVLSQLRAMTDGWAAGLVLLTEITRTRAIRSPFISELSRDAVFNYFANELFDKTDAVTADLLLKTSFFPSMTAAAAEELTGNPAAGAILSRLSRDHYFTEWRDLPAPAFQYHPLFREFLRLRARDTFAPEQLSALRCRTAMILEKEGRVEEAADLYRDAGETQQLVRIVLTHAQTLVGQGKSRTVEGWIGSIPKHVVYGMPWLLYWQGMCCLYTDPAASRRCQEMAYEGFRPAADAAGLYLSWAAAVNTFVYELGDFNQVDRWISELDGLRAAYPEFPSPEIGAVVAYAAFCALMYREPRHRSLPYWEGMLYAFAMSCPDIRFRALSCAHLSLFYTWWTGAEDKAARMVEVMRSLASSGKTDAFTVIVCQAFSAAYYWIVADAEQCRASVRAGLRIAQDSGIQIWNFVLLSQAVWAMTDEEPAAIRSHLRSMEFIRATGRSLDIAYYDYMLGWESLCRGNLSEARAYMDASVSATRAAGAPFVTAFFLTGLAEVMLESGEYDDAERRLEEALGLGLEMNSRTVEYQHAWVSAILCLRRGDREKALCQLGRHLALSRETGILHHPGWRSSVMAELYAVALEEGLEVEQARRLIRNHNLAAPLSNSLSGAPERWPYPVKIYTLGVFRLLRDDEPVEFIGKVQQKPLMMLKALIALGGRDVSERQLADILWPDADGDAAHKSFEMTLLRLRKLIGREGALQLRGGHLSLDSGACWVDVLALQEMTGKAGDRLQTVGTSRRRGSASASDAVCLAQRVLELYRGPFLDAEADQGWAALLRERTRSQVLQLVSLLGGHWEREGQWKEAADCYRRGIEIEGLYEDYYRQLMTCHEQLGERAEALRTYQRCRSALLSALGVTPSGETDAAYRRICGNDTK